MILPRELCGNFFIGLARSAEIVGWFVRSAAIPKVHDDTFGGTVNMQFIDFFIAVGVGDNTQSIGGQFEPSFSTVDAIAFHVIFLFGGFNK